ncbi:MAG: ParB/RepB/Spo0J family partition protein [Ruminococcaceae bacterium]|nr:ParB/RepB/Spo0J family partition protein [Oscillospiraceae bacterium]
MTKKVEKKGLGKGLGALLNTEEAITGTLEQSNELKITQIEPNKNQPRTEFDAEKLQELAESIKKYGVIQPIVVKKQENGFYKIIAGERRWRASKLAGLTKIPVLIREYDDRETMEIALVENLQREDLNPFEEARGYSELMDLFSLTQEQVAEKVGKSRSAVANSIRLLSLCDEIKELVLQKELTVGHVRALLSIENEGVQLMAARQIVKEGLTVRQTEALIKSLLKEKKVKKKNPVDEELRRYLSSLEKKLSSSLGTKVTIQNKKNRGKIEIEYYNNDDFERIMNQIS